MTHKVHVSLDDGTLKTIDLWASREGRTRCGIIREMARLYEERARAQQSRAEAKAQAMAVLHELAEADLETDELPDAAEFPLWRERLWDGSPRYAATDE